MYITVHLKNLTRMTVWNVNRVVEFEDSIYIEISNQPDKIIPKNEIDVIKLKP